MTDPIEQIFRDFYDDLTQPNDDGETRMINYQEWAKQVRMMQFGNDPRTRFVGTVVFAVAVIALDIASRSDRHMHTRKVVMRFF